jgi:hypothetical protein
MIYKDSHVLLDICQYIKKFIICANPNSTPSTKTPRLGSLNVLISLTIVNFLVQIR